MSIKQIREYLNQICYVSIEYGRDIMLHKANHKQLGTITEKQFVKIKSNYSMLRVHPDYSGKIVYQISSK